MFQSWRQKLKRARVAFEDGRLNEASRLLRQGSLYAYRPARELSADVATNIVERARDKAAQGETSAGWSDLEAAEGLNAGEQATWELRHNLVDTALADTHRDLSQGQPQRALSRLERLGKRHTLGDQGRTYRDVAAHVIEAQREARRGRFMAAEQSWSNARAVAPELEFLVTPHEQCKLEMAEHARLAQKLHQALTNAQWACVLESSERLLELAPDDPTARRAQRQAWRAVGLTRTHDPLRNPRTRSIESPDDSGVATQNARPSETPIDVDFAGDPSNSGDTDIPTVRTDTVAEQSSPNRFVMWIDAVGGFLVCLDDRIVLGQPTPENRVEVPILADLSRRHAVIYRDGEGYVIEPLHSVRVDEREIHGPAPLQDGSLIQLGGAVRMRFCRPHALSGTARLDFESQHKTQPSCDAILLMADSCVLGPSSHCHVCCRDWQQDMVIYRHGKKLQCRTTSPFQIDGQTCDSHGQVGFGSQIEGDDFSLSLEEV